MELSREMTDGIQIIFLLFSWDEDCRAKIAGIAGRLRKYGIWIQEMERKLRQAEEWKDFTFI